MKKILIIFLAIILLQSCGSNTEALLIGKWKTDTENIEKELENTDKENLRDSFSGLINNKLKGLLDINVEFKKDKTVELKVMGQSISGNWELIEEDDIKEIKIEGKLTQTIRIKSIAKDKLVLTGFNIKGVNLSSKEFALIPAK